MSTMVWDFVQQEAKCCGADTIYDWTTFNDNLKGGRKVPGSCCDGFPDAAQVSQCVLSPSIDNGAYTKGTCPGAIRIGDIGVPKGSAVLFCLCWPKGGKFCKFFEKSPLQSKPCGN